MLKDIFCSYINAEFYNLNLNNINKKILNLKKEDPKGRKISNNGGWQSNFFTQIQKPFEKLFNNINKSILTIQNKLKLKNKLVLDNYWCNINYLGSFNKPHRHNGSIVSGVYYVKVPKNSGNIVFTQPYILAMYQELYEFNQYNSETWNIAPEENKCLLFPSYLEHYVESNLNKKERISISFNYGFQKK